MSDSFPQKQSEKTRKAGISGRALRFEDLILELFQALGFVDIKANENIRYPAGHIEIDLIFGPQNYRTAVEVKFYRPSFSDVELLRRALAQAKRAQLAIGAKRAMLVISSDLVDEQRTSLEQSHGVEIWDRKKILQKAEDHPNIHRTLTDFMEVGDGDNRPMLAMAISHEAGESIDTGKVIARKLEEIKSGREESFKFENICKNALRYLFENNLTGWHEQSKTTDDLHRRDLVCRILPGAEVWDLILNDVKSRYVVFEFKNYSDKIGQHEIITTERYLYPTALRNVAVLISPHGCNASATAVIDGAMREHGKLILSFTVEEICGLLIGKDDGNDPNAYLFEKIDRFLMGLGR